MIKKFCKLFLLVVALFIGTTITNAESVKETLTIRSYNIASEPLIFPDAALNSQVAFKVKKTSDGKYVYCSRYGKKTPAQGITYTKGEQITDKGILFLISNGLNATNDTEFFQYQTALWIYLVETNQMQGSHNNIISFAKTIDRNTDEMSKHIRAMVEYAKTFDYTLAEKPTISVNDSNITFTLKDGYYISSKITVNSSEGSDYTANLTSAPQNTSLQQYDNYLIIKVPATSVTKTTNISFTVSNSKEIYTSYYYNPSDSNYQTMAVTYKEPATASDNGTVTLTKEPVITKIVKVDADTNEIVKGATLELSNSNGKIVATWETNGSAKEFTDLPAGTYTLTEKSAPKGYVKSDAKVIFKIDANGNLTDQSGNKLDKVTFTNKKEKIVTGVKISKQDITNKQELPGAKLTIKDYNGNIIKEFVSSNEPTFFELKPGIYTLSETTQPVGYILSTETITFTVKEDGTIDTVIMYNTPDGKEIVVENTASFKTIATTIIGLIASVFGAGLIFKKPKNLV